MSDPRHRSRSASALFLGVALSAMGYTILVTFLPLVSEDLLGNPRWSGLPSAFGTVGTAFGTTWLSRLMLRRGRRSGLVLGYLFAGAASVVAGLAAIASVFPLLALGLFGIGAGYASARLSRYAAAALFEPARRSAAIGWNVWAATLGSVVGPLLLAPIRSGTDSLGLPGAVGPFLTTGVTFAGAGVALALLFPASAREESVEDGASPEFEEAPASSWSSRARLALAALVTGQVVMVLIMTMTPIHIRAGGHGLHSVGLVMASHTFGMYAVSPLAGYLSDRLGRTPMIGAAVVCLFSSGVLAARAETGSPQLAFALWLLGLGWSFGFVAASALLTESTPRESRVRVQGLADSLVWGSAAAAQLGSGFFLTAFGYPALSLAGAALALTPLLFVRGRSRTIVDVPGLRPDP